MASGRAGVRPRCSGQKRANICGAFRARSRKTNALRHRAPSCAPRLASSAAGGTAPRENTLVSIGRETTLSWHARCSHLSLGVNAMNRRSAYAWFFATCVATLALEGCMGSEPRQANIPLSATGPKPLPGAQTDGEAERLVVGATSCWMGGLWSDALGEQDNPPFDVTGRSDARTAGIEGRCNALLVHLYGTVDPMQYRQLRAVDAHVVDDLAVRVRSVAKNDRADEPLAEQLVKLLRATANAQRENVLARDVADYVKKDVEGVSSPRERASDKALAAQALRRTAGIEALLSLDTRDLSHEARAIGLLLHSIGSRWRAGCRSTSRYMPSAAHSYPSSACNLHRCPTIRRRRSRPEHGPATLSTSQARQATLSPRRPRSRLTVSRWPGVASCRRSRTAFMSRRPSSLGAPRCRSCSAVSPTASTRRTAR